MTLWSALAPKDFPNGVVIFCSSDVSEVFHPSQPLLQRTLVCGQHFDTSEVKTALKVLQTLTYGVVVVDGDEATLGTMVVSVEGVNHSTKVCKLAHVSANIASRTRRGGQSATRYSRNRDAEELAFLRKISGIMSEAFAGLRGILVGGCADMKNKLKEELPPSIRICVARVVDIPHAANFDGLQKMVSHINEVAIEDHEQEEKRAVVRFMELLAQTETHSAPLVCYGEAHTKAALQMGAVREVLVSVDPAGFLFRQKDVWIELATASGASVVEVHPRSYVENRFCNGFGIGACLRYPVDPFLLEEGVDFKEPKNTHNAAVAALTESGRPASCELDSDIESNTTAPSEADTLLHEWLREVLTLALHDGITAESLAIGTELVLFDDTLAVEERLQNASEMLLGEGVPKDVLDELAYHVCDYFGMDLQ